MFNNLKKSEKQGIITLIYASIWITGIFIVSLINLRFGAKSDFLFWIWIAGIPAVWITHCFNIK